MSTTSDSELVLRAQGGDPTAVAQIYERYAPAIYRYIYFRVNDAELAEDLQADVFLRMLEGIDRYQERGWPISAWLFRIAHDRLIDALRKRYRRQQVPLEIWAGTYDGPEIATETRIAYDEIKLSLKTLTDDQRQVIQLRFLADLSIQEVASQLGRTEGAVKALQQRGLRSLERRLQPYAAAV